MSRQTKGELQRVGGIVLLVVSALFWFVAFRFVSFPALIVTWIIFVKSGRTNLRLSLMAWAVFVALTFSPIDVFPIPKWGRPRLVPLEMGLPRREALERAKRGEVILGGDLVSGFEPKYYLVW